MIYVDDFTHDNSNKYWLDAFKKYIPNIIHYDIIKKDPKQILVEILLKEPDHIHFGGSIKNEKKFPIKYIHRLKEHLPNTKITFFYGDAYYSNYHRDIIKYIDKLFISHKPNDIKDKIEYMPCPTYMDSTSTDKEKIYEVSFIGNNYSDDRLKDLKKISKICDLTVIGKNWENTGLKFRNFVSYKNFSDIVSKSKFCLGSTLYIPCEWNSSSCSPKTKLCHNKNCSKYRSEYGYFSNRIMNLCGCSGCVLHIYGEGLDKIFTDTINIIFFDNLKNLKEKIQNYSLNDTIKIGKNAYNLSRNYTFNKISEKIIRGIKE